MGLKKLFTGLCRRGLSWLPTKPCPAYSHSAENTENDYAKGVSSVELSALASSKGEKMAGNIGQSEQRRLRNISLVGLLLVLLLTFFTVNDSFSGADSPQCRSIYMYPSYARIDGFDLRFTPLAQKYHLYLYREQGKDKAPLENDKVNLDGVPVLFIPGNAGSFKQVRSIAAAGSNLYYDNLQEVDNTDTQNLDFFAADFNEDFTAFHGRTMLDQAEYLNDAIRYILSLYAEADDYTDPVPTSVIVIGHSMGGIVARILPTLQNHVDGSIRTILTLSSPHAAAPVTFDGDILKIYEQTNDYWREQMKNKASFLAQNVSLVSITGGIQDLMLPADYTAVENIVPPENGFTTYSTGVPGVWTPIDHLAIVWCDQLRTKVAKLLLEIVDRRIDGKVMSLYQRMQVFRKVLLTGLEEVNSPNSVTANFERYSKDFYSHTFEESQVLKNDAKLIINQSSIKSSPKFHKFSLLSAEGDAHFSLLTSVSDLQVWFCKDKHQKLRCVSASPDFVHVPASFQPLKYPAQSSLGNDRKPFELLSISGELLSRYDSLFIKTPSQMANENDFIFATLHPVISTDVHETPLQLALFGKEILLPEDAQYVGLRFTKLWDSLLSYRIHCSASLKTDESALFEPFIRQWVEDPLETKWHINVGNSDIDVNMHNVAPFIPLEEEHDKSLKLDIILPPEVKLKLQMKINWPLTFKMLFIRYRLSFLCFPIALACFTMAHQFFWYRQTGGFTSFDCALAYMIKRYGLAIFLALVLLSPITNFKPVQKVLFMLDPIHLNRPFLLESEHMHTNFYYLGIRGYLTSSFGAIFGLMSVGILHLIAQIFELSANLISKVTVRRFKQANKKANAEAKIFFMDRKRLAACLLLIGAVYFYIPYQLASAISLLIQLGNCVRTSRASPSRSLEEQKNLKNYNFTILLLLIFVVAIDAPTIIVFLHNVAIKWETPFRSHHNVMAIAPIIFLVSANSTFSILPSRSKSIYDGPVTALLLGYTGFFSLIYGARNIFWIHHLINITFAWMFFTMYASLSSSNPVH